MQCSGMDEGFDPLSPLAESRLIFLNLQSNLQLAYSSKEPYGLTKIKLVVENLNKNLPTQKQLKDYKEHRCRLIEQISNLQNKSEQINQEITQIEKNISNEVNSINLQINNLKKTVNQTHETLSTEPEQQKMNAYTNWFMFFPGALLWTYCLGKDMLKNSSIWQGKTLAPLAYATSIGLGCYWAFQALRSGYNHYGEMKRTQAFIPTSEEIVAAVNSIKSVEDPNSATNA